MVVLCAGLWPCEWLNAVLFQAVRGGMFSEAPALELSLQPAPHQGAPLADAASADGTDNYSYSEILLFSSLGWALSNRSLYRKL